MTTTTRKVQNPDNLTPDQIGEGYRLTFEEEILSMKNDLTPQWWDDDCWRPRAHVTIGRPLSSDITYRVPLDTPPPPERFTIKPLVWEKMPGSEHWHKARTPWGFLSYSAYSGENKRGFWSWENELVITHVKSLERAKAAAEAAYVARVKELLNPA